jgi:hypothetical protein
MQAANRLAIVMCFAVSACATEQKLNWGRSDGKPFVAGQFENDRMTCSTEFQKDSDDFRRCMERKGYRQQAGE